MWLRSNPGRVVTVDQIGDLFGKAYMKAATVQNAVEGFQTTSLFPVNKYRFGPADFPLHPLPTTTTSSAVEGTSPTPLVKAHIITSSLHKKLLEADIDKKIKKTKKGDNKRTQKI